MKLVPVISCKKVCFSYLNDGIATQILKDINFEIYKGEFVAIQGTSGSGKSTLLYLLGLLAKPESGSIRLFDQEIMGLEDDVLSRLRHEKIGFIFQQFHLLSKASVLTNVLLPLDYDRSRSPLKFNFEDAENLKFKKTQRASMLIAKFGLQNRIGHLPNQLSGGQQQRVAIARALLNEPDLILADEPTGNLDSKSAELIFEDLRQLNLQSKKTIIIITHDRDLALRCDRVISIKDGSIENLKSSEFRSQQIAEIDIADRLDEKTIRNTKDEAQSQRPNLNGFQVFRKIVQDTFRDFSFLNFLNNAPKFIDHLNRHRIRSLLTMLGISVGVAAVFSMMTLGVFTKERILAGYAELGVNSLMFYGYQNWDLKATDRTPAIFQSFNWDRDLEPLQKIFPEIKLISPLLTGWSANLSFAGRTIDQDVRLLGVGKDSIFLNHRRLVAGRNFIPEEIEQSASVCIIGFEIGEKLFLNTPPIGQVLKITEDENSFGCRIIGVLASSQSNKEYVKPNTQVLMPFTFYQVANSGWSARIREVQIQVRDGENTEVVGQAIRAFFEQKYGVSGEFRVGSDTVLISQMNRFLTLFTILLSAIAMITLVVGGMGITNMMLVSVSERYREIGLRRALGATTRDIRTQLLSESILLCTLAGVAGLIIGFFTYSAAIWAGTKFMPQLTFEWTINTTALLVSMISILVVGILSGLFPALKAERLQVIEALRSE